MPGAAQDLPFAAIGILVDLRGQRRPDDAPQAHPRALMRANILERVEGSFQIEDTDLAPGHPHDLAPAGWNLVALRDYILAHLSLFKHVLSVVQSKVHCTLLCTINRVW